MNRKEQIDAVAGAYYRANKAKNDEAMESPLIARFCGDVFLTY